MAKKRYINTKFWDDIYVSNLDPIEKLLFLYFLTNPVTDICGIYEIPFKRVALDTGIDKEMVEKIIRRFENDDKIYYIDGWIFVKNFAKHQAVNPSIQKGIERNKEEIPSDIMAKISEIEQTGTRLVTDCDLLKPKPKPKPKLKLREEESLLLQLKKHENDYSISMLEDFELYWGAKTPNGNPLWEEQTTWDLPRRLRTWKKKEEKWDWERSQARQLKEVNEMPTKERPAGADSGMSSLGDLLTKRN